MEKNRPRAEKSIRRSGPSRRIDPSRTATRINEVRKLVGSTKGRRTPEEARQEIIDVARAYISKHGLKDLTVDKLMQGTEIGRSAFYSYFGSISELASVFVYELSSEVVAVSSSYFEDNDDPLGWIRAALRGGVEFFAANGPMMRALWEASLHDDRLAAAFNDEIGSRPIRGTTQAILRDQAKGWIGPMDAEEISFALNRFIRTYLTERFGDPRQKRGPAEKEKAFQILERVCTATLYGKVTKPRRSRTSPAKPRPTRSVK